jgi:hypothetical protein
MKQRIHLESVWYGRGFNLRILRLDACGEPVAEAGPAVFTAVEQGAAIGEPVTRLDKDACQQMMDELWNLGFRPERGEMSVGQVAATNAHLQDMRTLAFAKLGVPKP